MSAPHLKSRWEDKKPKRFSASVPHVLSEPHTLSVKSSHTRTYYILQLEHTFYVYSIPHLALRLIISPPTGKFYSHFDINHDKLLAVTYSDGTVHVWDLLELKLGFRIQDPTLAPEFRPRWLHVHFVNPGIVESEDCYPLRHKIWPQVPTLMVQDPSLDGDIFWIWQLSANPPKQAKSPDGDSPIQVAPSFLRRLDTHAQVLVFRTRGKILAAGCLDCTVRIWDIMKGECSWVLLGPAGRAFQICLDQDRVYSGSYDGTIYIWDVHTGDCLCIFNPCLGRVVQLDLISSVYVLTRHETLSGQIRLHTSL